MAGAISPELADRARVAVSTLVATELPADRWVDAEVSLAALDAAVRENDPLAVETAVGSLSLLIGLLPTPTSTAPGPAPQVPLPAPALPPVPPLAHGPAGAAPQRWEAAPGAAPSMRPMTPDRSRSRRARTLAAVMAAAALAAAGGATFLVARSGDGRLPTDTIPTTTGVGAAPTTTSAGVAPEPTPGATTSLRPTTVPTPAPSPPARGGPPAALIGAGAVALAAVGAALAIALSRRRPPGPPRGSGPATTSDHSSGAHRGIPPPWQVRELANRTVHSLSGMPGAT